MRFLLIEDNEQLAEAVLDRLMLDGHVIDHAPDIQTAHDFTATTSYDLILLDIAMPELNGFEVIETLHDNPITQDIPIILLTATRYIESEFENNTSLTVHKSGGLNTSEVIKSIHSLLDTLL